MSAVEQYANLNVGLGNAQTTINMGGGLGSGTTSMTVTAFTGFPSAAQYRILIEDEIILVTGGAGTTTWTIARGQEGTSAASHANGTTVTHVLTRDGLKGVSGSINLSDTYTNLPAAGTVGRLYQPSDGLHILRDNGTLWTPFGPSFPMTIPPAETGQTTTLSGNGGSISSGATSANVASSSGFPTTPFIVRIGTEDIKVTNVSGTTWTIVRGYNGTSTASHNDGDTVTLINWEWANQGGASLVTTQGGIFLQAPAVSGLNARVRKNVAPLTDYKVTAYIDVAAFCAAFHTWGLTFRKASTGQLKTLEFISINPNDLSVRVAYWSDANTVISAAASNSISAPLKWFQIEDDSTTNRIFRLSADGQNWITLYTEGRTTDFTADEYGFFASTDNTSAPALGLTVFSWLVN